MKGIELASGELDTMDSSTERNHEIRKMAYIKMVMREMGMDQEEATEYVDNLGLDEVIKKFQKRDPEKMEEEFETIKGSLGKYRNFQRELDAE